MNLWSESDQNNETLEKKSVVHQYSELVVDTNEV